MLVSLMLGLALLFVGRKVLAVDISMNIQLGGNTMTSTCDNEDIITATNKEELRQKLQEKLEKALAGNIGEDVTISTHIYQNGNPIPVSKYDVTTDDVTSKQVTSTHSTQTVLESTPSLITTEFTTRSGTSTAPDLFESMQTTDSPTLTTSDVITSDVSTTVSMETSTKNPLCELKIGHNCYWAQPQMRQQHNRGTLNFTTAEAICKAQNSQPANVPDENSYKEMIEYLQSKILTRQMSFWTGIKVNPRTGTRTPNDAFISWQNKTKTTPPFTGAAYTNVLFQINQRNYNLIRSYMQNREPGFKAHGVICAYKPH
uniref:uncharacterized protein LOC120327811 n=1 Tax=Styela clava TaxID=7725 RepID=UPI00193A71D4|nr:uncharacterized protein LOC120327811 [Styela clava]